MDIVIPYRRSRSEELIYTLRSLKNVQHGEVFIIGDDPNLQNIHHIPYRQTSDIAYNTHTILNIACSTPEISENFIWMADDMYFMKPVQTIPVLHRGAYDDIIASYSHRLHNFYVNRMIKTNEKLKSMGIEKPLCYEVHAPFVINKSKWNKLEIPGDYNKLSMYGNLCNLGGTKTKDVKVRSKDWVPKGCFASSYDNTFRTNRLGKLIREIFPEKSEYER